MLKVHIFSSLAEIKFRLVLMHFFFTCAMFNLCLFACPLASPGRG